MNRNLLLYMWQDIRTGLIRNRGAALAAIALIFVSTLLIGTLLMARMLLSDAVTYIESQLSMKVYVESGVNPEHVAFILQEQSYVSSVEIEQGEDLLNRLEFFFTGKEHLLQSFKNNGLPDAIVLQIQNKDEISYIAEQLALIDGIEKVIYPQQMAETLNTWLTTIQTYGLLITIFSSVLAFTIVYIAFRLSLYQRAQEIRVKLLIGADPKIVRTQFLSEGCLLGFAGSFLAMLLTIVCYFAALKPLIASIPIFTTVDSRFMMTIFISQLVAGTLIGVTASYISTRKLIHHV
ncbi:MAG: cell division protein FtsX [Bacillus sp. (in: firmicutes)]